MHRQLLGQTTQRWQRLGHIGLAFSLLCGLSVESVKAGTIGTPTDANFNATTLDVEACAIQQTGGTLGYSLDRTGIGSSSAMLGISPQGTPESALISVSTNLAAGQILIEDPVLTLAAGTATPTSSQVSVNGSATSGSAAVNIGAEELNEFTLDVMFSLTSGRFVAGTYTAKATLTCTDDGNKTGAAS